ncbi:MAG: hypothetical protein U0165_02720 [Polyangiaceae bacterium]
MRIVDMPTRYRARTYGDTGRSAAGTWQLLCMTFGFLAAVGI